MSQRIAIIQGHPDPAGGHLDHALADAYARGAEGAGHEVVRIDVAGLDFPLLRTQADFEHGKPPPGVRAAQETLTAADHWVIVFPLWLGTTPALLKGFLEQVFRPGFAFSGEDEGMPRRLLKGRSARLVVTMGMPVLLYRTWFRAHGVKFLELSVLRLCGVKPVRTSLFGLVETRGDRVRERWLARMERLGRQGR